MNGHLSDEQFESYRLRLADAAEMAAMTQHLAGCTACRGTLVRKKTGALVEGLLEEQPWHLMYEEMERYVDGEADDIDREIVESHLEACGECAREIEELRRCVAETRLVAPVQDWRVATASMAAPAGAEAQARMRALAPVPAPAPARRGRRWAWWVIAVAVVAVVVWWIWARG